MKKLCLGNGAILLAGMSLIILLGISACSSSSTVSLPTLTPPITPSITPVIQYVNATITEVGSPISGANVNVYTHIYETGDVGATTNVIYYYDVQPPTTPDVPAYTASGTYQAMDQLSQPSVWKNVPAGRHTFSAQIVLKNNTPLNPPETSQCVIDVPPVSMKAPEIRIMSIQVSVPVVNNAPSLPIAPFQVEVDSDVSNIMLADDKIGQANVAGEGHIIYYLNVDPPTVAGQPAVTASGTFKATTEAYNVWENVPAGENVFSLQIVNNDNTPLDPPVVGQIIVTLTLKE
jgi:hypothetical protein